MNEFELKQNYETIIGEHFRNSFIDGTFRGAGADRIRYVRQKSTSSENALVILGGRTEFIEKYAELFYDLRVIDVSMYSFDLRGQGLSSRLIGDPHKGHVNDFSDYIEDLRIFLTEVVGQHQHKNIVVLAFSLGGAVTASFQQIYKGHISAAVLCSPMFAIHFFPLPEFLVRWIADKFVERGNGENYILRGKPYNFGKNFKNNKFTSSKIRYEINQDLVQNSPDLALGGPTYSWLRESLLSSKQLLDRAEEIDIPILLLQSGKDRVVNSTKQNLFCDRAHNCRLETIKHARHELLMERDIMRDQALKHIKDFLKSHCI